MTEEFNHVSLLMQEPLPDEPEALILALENIEVWNSRMQFLLAAANFEVSTESFEALPESGTELERKTAMACTIAEVKEERDKIEGLCEAIKTRITLGQSILKYYSTTQNIQYKDTTKSLKEILGDK
jgi:hypothetical protein